MELRTVNLGCILYHVHVLTFFACERLFEGTCRLNRLVILHRGCHSLSLRIKSLGSVGLKSHTIKRSKIEA
jgi:hypothetical protein